MKKQIEQFIDTYDEVGNIFLNEFLIPLIQTGKTLANESTTYKNINNFIENKRHHKINLYLQNFDSFSNKDELIKALNLNKEYKNFFLSSIEKVIYLDDNLQIYILSYLTSQYIKHNELNYWEESLYYNINSLSHSDFCEYAFMIETARFSKEEKNKSSFYEITTNNSIHIIIKNKFINIGLLLNDTVRYGGNINTFQKSEYTDNLYKIIKNSPFYK